MFKKGTAIVQSKNLGFVAMWLIVTILLPQIGYADDAQRQQQASYTATPLRHLEYAFSVDYQTLGQSESGAIGTRVGTSLVSYVHGSGRQGKMLVDILAAPKDGGLVIRASEWLQSDPLPSQSFICAVYPDTRVICPPELPVTDAENTVMEFLGRNFINPANLDGANHWKVAFQNSYVSLDSNFVIDEVDTAHLATITGTSVVKSVDGNGSNWDEKSKIVYDLTKTVPTSIHDVAIQSAQTVATSP